MTILSFLFSTSYYLGWTLLFLAVCAAGLLYFCQTFMVYPSMLPEGSRTTVSTPDKNHMPHYVEVPLTTPDGFKLHAYMITKKSKHTSPTILLYLHANAGNMGHRLPIAYRFLNTFDTSVFMLSYRGYGKSEGFATEKGLKIDSQCALDWIKSTYPSSRVIVYGQSIGGIIITILFNTT